jgi:glycogen debranching enzyme
LLGPYITAYLNAFGRSRERMEHCASLLAAFGQHLEEGLLGNVAEVFDADPPHAPGGAPAQAWSVAELLRVLKVELRTC